MKREIRILILLTIVFTYSINAKAQEIERNDIWVSKFNALIKGEQFDILGYMDLTNKVIRNESKLMDKYSATDAFKPALTLKASFNRSTKNLSEVLSENDDLKVFKTIYNNLSWKQQFKLEAGYLITDYFSNPFNTMDQINYRYTQTYGSNLPKVTNAFDNLSGEASFLSWSLEERIRVLKEFKTNLDKYPALQKEFDKFLKQYPEFNGENERVTNVLNKHTLGEGLIFDDPFNNSNSTYSVMNLIDKAEIKEGDIKINQQSGGPSKISLYKKNQSEIDELGEAFKIVATLAYLAEIEGADKIDKIGSGITSILTGVNQAQLGSIPFASGSSIITGITILNSAFASKGPSELEVVAKRIQQMEERIIAKLKYIDAKLDLLQNQLSIIHEELSSQILELSVDVIAMNNRLSKARQELINGHSIITTFEENRRNEEISRLINNSIGIDRFREDKTITEEEFEFGLKQLQELIEDHLDDPTSTGEIPFVTDLSLYNRLNNTNYADNNILFSGYINDRYDEEILLKSNIYEVIEFHSYNIHFIKNNIKYLEKYQIFNIDKYINDLNEFKNEINRIDSLLIDIVFFEDYISSLNDGHLKNVKSTIGLRQEFYLNQVVKQFGRFLSLRNFSNNGYNLVFKNSIKPAQNNFYTTLSGKQIPLEINASSTFVPKFKDDWIQGSSVLKIDNSSRGAKMNERQIVQVLPIYQRNSLMFKQLKYVNANLERNNGDYFKWVHLYSGTPTYDRLLSYQVEGHSLNFSWMNKGGNISVIGIDGTTRPKNKRKYIESPNILDIRLKEWLIDRVNTQLQSDIEKAIANNSDFKELEKLLIEEKIRIQFIRNYLLMFHFERVSSNQEIMEIFFSNKAYPIRNAFKSISIKSDDGFFKNEESNIYSVLENQRQLMNKLFSKNESDYISLKIDIILDDYKYLKRIDSVQN